MARQRIESPFPQWPGWIEIPEIMDAQQYLAWWQRTGEIEDETDDRPASLRTWDGRFCLLLGHQLDLGENDDGEPYMIEQSGEKLPSPIIAVWFQQETDHLIREATDLKNWRGPSGDTSSTTGT